jgi:adenosylmethionine-8-amino-7-oxononanoate aminotransferase
MGTYLLEQLQGLRQHPTVGDIRGLGLIAGVELVKDQQSKEKFALDSDEVKTLNTLLVDRGLLTRATHIISLAPPLCITRAEVDRVVEILDSSLTTFEQQYGYQ